ncbi:putative pyridoxamine 5'-phosphate oxidase [Dictyobacter vulcani]|uniref:Putative pyridoxamine 5'-phosphate oxidase n=1 Tax=Dictyobacter vulcani TaxID=2607529 RepID=A0A5J4KPV0_9CHLR|nr:PPOX class F420-dependent oxidoreductase [Dictyobacter vulcani]GER91404.1 putative pyridoxamine 5'-phosphate oxidase [Dictyobacter vulcani]
MVLSDEVRQALTSGHLAHLTTLNKDGSPQVTVVWVGLDNDEIVCAHMNLHKKVQNIQRDARVALSMETGGKTNTLDNYLVINGHARITEGGAPELLNKLAQIYIGPGTKFIPDGAPAGYITRITVDSVHGMGPWSKQH